MAKGLGAIMAQVAIDKEKARLESLDAIACPFCGRSLENSGIAYFCYGGPPHEEKCHKLPALEDVFGGSWDAQGRVVAAVVIGSEPVVECLIVRGGYGMSNLSVTTNKESRDKVPQLIKASGWTFLNEVYHLSKEVEEAK